MNIFILVPILIQIIFFGLWVRDLLKMKKERETFYKTVLETLEELKRS